MAGIILLFSATDDISSSLFRVFQRKSLKYETFLEVYLALKLPIWAEMSHTNVPEPSVPSLLIFGDWQVGFL